MIVLFSRSISPRRGGSTVVTENLARCFSRDQLCIVGGRKIFEEPIARSATEVEVLTLGSEINFRGRGDRFFKLFRWLLLPFLLGKATAFCTARRCTCVVAAFPDEFFLLLGLKVARRLGVPFFAYLHNTLVENRTGWRLAVATRIQKKVSVEAEKVLVISDGMRRYYQSQYPNVTVVTIPHMFANYPDEARDVAVIGDRAIKTVALCGNFNETNIEATRRVVKALGGSDDFRICIYTPVPRALLKLRGIDVEAVSGIEYVADQDFMSRLVSADLLVLTHGLHGGLGEVEYLTIFPTRTIPLLLAGKPLLVHAPANSFLAEFIRQHGCGLLVDEPSEEALLAAAKALTTDRSLAEAIVTRAHKTVSMFHGPEVKRRFQSVIGAAGAYQSPEQEHRADHTDGRSHRTSTSS